MQDFLSREKKIYVLILWILTVVLASLLYSSLFHPPKNFPAGTVFSIEPGLSLQELAHKLDEDGVVKTSFWFRTVAIFLGGERLMKAGEYLLEEPEGAFRLAWRIMHGNFGLESHRITIPEGFSVSKIAELFDDKFVLLDREAFFNSAREGYLFPDTYFLTASATASSTLELLSSNFERKVEPLLPAVAISGRTLEEIITMASILEGEAIEEEDRKIVSGILWKRLDIGMALQVDTAFVYLLGKGTKDLTAKDLKTDSPYNTYLYRGLPPTPISNPGIESIKAAIFPKETEYLYFLTADDGTMHYSKTFDEHVEKKRKYIK